MKRLKIRESEFGFDLEAEKDKLLNDLDTAIYKYVQNPRFGIKVVADDEEGNYRIKYDADIVDVSFNTDPREAHYKYIFTINDEGPYVHNNPEFIADDIMAFVDNMYED